MATGKKITALDPAASLTGGELFEIVQVGANKKATISQVHDYVASTLTTSDISEGANKYFTEGRVLGAVLTGLSIAGGPVVATDNLLVAVGKLQNQFEVADNTFVFGTGSSIGASSSTYTGNDNVLVVMTQSPPTVNDPSNFINNVFVFGEAVTLNGNPSGGGTITDTGIFGGGHHIGDGVSYWGGSTGFAYGNSNNLYNNSGMVGGEYAEVQGSDGTTRGGIAIGLYHLGRDVTKRVIAAASAVNISSNSSAQTSGNGALGQAGFIAGGYDHHIPANSPNVFIGGGHGIVARASDPDQAYFMNLNIVSAPANDDALTQVLVRNPLTGQIKYRSASSLGGASNALLLAQANTRNPVADETTSVNLDYDFSIEQQFLIRTYLLGDDTNDVGVKVSTDLGSLNASLYGRASDGSESYFRVNSFNDIAAKVSNPTNSFVQDLQVNTGSGAVTLTGTGSNNSYVQTGFKSGSYTFSGALASYQVVVDNGGGPTGFLKLKVTNTSTTEPLIILDTPGNSGIRLFGNGSISTGNILKSKNNLGDSQWGSIDLSLPAAVGTSVLRMVNGGLGAALTDPNANKILAWDDTDNSIGFWTIGAGLSYDHATHTLSSGTANLDTYFEIGTDFTSAWANTIMASVTFNNGGGLGSSTSSTFGVDSTEQASGVVALGTSNSTAGGSAIADTTNTHTFGFGFKYELSFRAALETLSDGTNTYKVRLGFASTWTTQAAITDGAYFRYTHGTNSGKWEAVTISNGVETVQDTGVTADVTTYHVFKVTANEAGTSVSFSIDGTVTNTISSNIINSASRLTGRIATIEKTAGSANRNLHLDYVKFVTSRSTAR